MGGPKPQPVLNPRSRFFPTSRLSPWRACRCNRPRPSKRVAMRASRRAGWQPNRNRENSMVRIAVLGLSLIVVGVEAGCAQDIAGIEDCTKTSGLDKRTGCLQSNVNFLQRLVTKNALDARNKLDDAASEIVALKGVVSRLQKTVEQLQAAQKRLSTRSRRPSSGRCPSRISRHVSAPRLRPLLFELIRLSGELGWGDCTPN